MVIFVLAMVAVVASLWARTCFASARLASGRARQRWLYHGAFWSAGAAAFVGLALLARSPGFALAALAAFAGFLAWGLRLKLAKAPTDQPPPPPDVRQD
jgi:hypothetical protein